jgi:hypothetical protein
MNPMIDWLSKHDITRPPLATSRGGQRAWLSFAGVAIPLEYVRTRETGLTRIASDDGAFHETG